MSDIELKNCPITGIEVENHSARWEHFKMPALYYEIKYRGEDYYIGICQFLYPLLLENEEYLKQNRLEENSKKLKEYLPLFLGEMGKDDFKDLFNKTIHLDCPKPKENPERHLNILVIAEEVKSKGNYPQSYKEKGDLILRGIKNIQSYDGEKIQIIKNFGFWGKFYLKNEQEFNFYLNEFKNREYIEVDSNYVSLTLKGLEYIENLTSQKNIMEEPKKTINNITYNAHGTNIIQTTTTDNASNKINQSGADYKDEQLIKDLKDLLEIFRKLDLESETENSDEIKSELSRIEIQSNKEKPNRKIVKQSLELIQTMATNIISNWATNPLKEIFTKLLHE